MLSFLDRRLHALRRAPPDAETLIEQARRRTGLDDFGDAPFREGLRVFLRACAEEADLRLFGRLGTRWDTGRFLVNLLRLRDAERRAPAILDEPIGAPIFITGLPRSGTTFLHRLLAEDEANRVPRVWQLIHPYPEPGGHDRRRQKVARQLRMFGMLAPEFRHMHPIGADSPQECSEITAHIFASLRFDSTYFVPSYRHWLDDRGHLDAYRFHRRFLQHLQYQSAGDRSAGDRSARDRSAGDRPGGDRPGGAGRWVLKCPDHVFALDEIRSVYPDARIVFVHRDPMRVLLSATRLTEVLRRPFTRHVDRAALGRQECERWGIGAGLIVEAADREPFAEPIHHIHYRDLVGDPLGTVERLYRHFGLTLGTRAAARITRLTAASPDGGYGANHYRFETFDIDPVAARERFAPYLARFAIDPERGGDRRGSAPAPILRPGRSAGIAP
ncbi:MAG TPA: sulfotransferase [Stellaceae bacterium]